jgi:hypothetical protein
MRQSRGRWSVRFDGYPWASAVLASDGRLIAAELNAGRIVKINPQDRNRHRDRHSANRAWGRARGYRPTYV